jgi:hypothetical protein
MTVFVLTHVEGEPSTQLHPAGTELHISVAVESTCLDAKVGNACNTECQSLRDAEIHVAPHGVGVTCDEWSVPHGYLDLLIGLTSPSASERAATSKRASCEEEGSLSTIGSNESVV